MAKSNAYLTIELDKNNPDSKGFDLGLDVIGGSRFDRILIKDRKTGKDFELFVEDGEISIEPCEKDDKRQYRINKILEGGNK